jgi:hypothetical protein
MEAGLINKKITYTERKEAAGYRENRMLQLIPI